MDPNESLCLVCGKENYETNFQILVCKCCATFMRRCLASDRVFRCKQNTNKCDLTKSKKLCRACRYNRCKELNMTPKSYKNSNVEVGNVILNDPTLSVQSVESSSNIQSVLSNSSTGQIKVEERRVIFDFQPTIDTIRSILSSKNYLLPKVDDNSTVLQDMIKAYDKFILKLPIPKREDVKLAQEFDFVGFLEYYQTFAIHTAEMLMELEQFARINEAEKWQLFTNFTRFYFEFTKAYNSVKTFGHELSETTFMVDNKTAHKMGPLELVGNDFSKEMSSELSRLFSPILLFEEEFIYSPMKELKLDKMEVAFMMLEVLYARKNMNGIRVETTTYHEKLLRVACCELNNYYFVHKQNEHFLWRICQMTKMIERIKQAVDRKGEVFMIARIFDILVCNILETELTPVYK